MLGDAVKYYHEVLYTQMCPGISFGNQFYGNITAKNPNMWNISLANKAGNKPARQIKLFGIANLL